MKFDHGPFGALRAKSRSLRHKNDRTRIQASSAIACDGGLTSPKLAQHRHSHEDLTTSHGSSRTTSADSVAHHHLHDDFSTNSPVLLRGDKELHDPNFVRHNWEMMSGESTFPDNQLHIGRAASPHLTSRRSTLSSRTGSSRPSSRSGSEAGSHHPPSFGLGVNAFSGLASYSKGGSVGRASGARSSSSTRGLQVEGSILRDEEAILDSDDDSSDDEDDDEYGQARYSTYHIPTSRRTSPAPRSPLFSGPPSPALSHTFEQQQAAAYHRRRHWTVAEGSQASNGAGVHTLPGHMPRGSVPTIVNERSYSHPA
ncbi:uncharacterized protein SRS1_11580 [Sporisorium reilianum f. sp. reilianum]|uniref:Uncharacterized protein n=1 Tax=Sporisorium reilianum f. sp. reilianum TaxID=72559 RepID=A0A2N8U5F2_9BASI|nr:uncharacterized protein SRS1_11580 [Sporisorium reilianum f. sp. reilianum]